MPLCGARLHRGRDRADPGSDCRGSEADPSSPVAGVLPPPRRPRHAPRPVVFGPESEPPLPPPPATIEAVRPLSLVPVLDRTSHNALLWKQFIARYHYLGYKPMAGAQMRYTVVDRHGASLAMIGMAAAAWKTAPRDHAHRMEPGDPGAQSPSCGQSVPPASTALDRHPKPRIPHPVDAAPTNCPATGPNAIMSSPVLMETFVETPRFAGTIYKAAKLDLYRHQMREGSPSFRIA